MSLLAGTCSQAGSDLYAVLGRAVPLAIPRGETGITHAKETLDNDAESLQALASELVGDAPQGPGGPPPDERRPVDGGRHRAARTLHDRLAVDAGPAAVRGETTVTFTKGTVDRDVEQLQLGDG